MRIYVGAVSGFLVVENRGVGWLGGLFFFRVKIHGFFVFYVLFNVG